MKYIIPVITISTDQPVKKEAELWLKSFNRVGHKL